MEIVMMALPARKIAAEDSMESRISRLEATTEHIQSDVRDLRQDTKGFRQEMKELRQETKELLEKLDAKFDSKLDRLQKSFESMKIGRVWDRVWMLLAMGTLLGVMARGFQWI